MLLMMFHTLLTFIIIIDIQTASDMISRVLQKFSWLMANLIKMLNVAKEKKKFKFFFSSFIEQMVPLTTCESRPYMCFQQKAITKVYNHKSLTRN